ncbi:hypothetical protein PBCVNY2B_432R [Paramecium bursaria Chlorella virus NY2B]|uniref:Uncharacterized protein n=1 Tax=Paramecium bursaria Chlorella virus NYs1 TaxID=83442 RepID=M1I884_9PHYC|nr:hypothetical protein FK949_gp164 [Paramecium bursaria Chlorella virus NYs1]AGE54233.1 hypothetical protein PBCVIL52s1_449R [Paramecium bursaria Chlorella virus IL-5-2s1]AGE54873.1 hypothetical protein PBCVMA1D_315R [Paramecium bursaria Chlorella virus MA1D]AGE58348.1 hypothetical protein PBCVNY2B_432R [Paramecium bursaria Chlorella virus NY2B]AGE58729.1 hypothetical protein PBCVNYs1_435R [Paramecium bursaria Chlorella virus NYs1]
MSNISTDVILSVMYDELVRLLEDERDFENRLKIIEKGRNIEKKKEYSRILSKIRKDILEITRQIRYSENYIAERQRLGIT